MHRVCIYFTEFTFLYFYFIFPELCDPYAARNRANHGDVGATMHVRPCNHLAHITRVLCVMCISIIFIIICTRTLYLLHWPSERCVYYCDNIRRVNFFLTFFFNVFYNNFHHSIYTSVLIKYLLFKCIDFSNEYRVAIYIIPMIIILPSYNLYYIQFHKSVADYLFFLSSITSCSTS